MDANGEEIGNLRTQIGEVDGGYQKLRHENARLEGKVAEMKQVYTELREREKDNQTTYNKTVTEMEDKVNLQNEKAQDNIRNLVGTQKELQMLKSQCEQLQAKIEIAQGLNAFHESCNYKEKIAALKKEIESSKLKGHEIEKSINGQTQKWNDIYEQTTVQMRS